MRYARKPPQLRRGPYTAGTRAFLSNYPLEYTLRLLDGPRLYRAGTIEICGPNQSIVLFDDGERSTVRTKALNIGEPPNA